MICMKMTKFKEVNIKIPTRICRKNMFLSFIVLNGFVALVYFYINTEEVRKEHLESVTSERPIVDWLHQNMKFNTISTFDRENTESDKLLQYINVSKFDHPLLADIKSHKQVFCNGNFISYGYFVYLHHVVIDLNQTDFFRVGGENLTEVINKKEEEEFIKTKLGFFKMHCESKQNRIFSIKDGYLKNWEESLQLTKAIQSATLKEHVITIAIVRYEYANLYWVIVDLYDIFFLSTILGIHPGNLQILIVDAHPRSIIDKIWPLLFSKVTRIGNYGTSDQVIFETLVWAMHRRNSPLLKNGNFKFFPFLEEFRTFVVSKISKAQTVKEIDCNLIAVTIVFRRDYIAHPRNPSGKVSRKIANEIELLRNVSIALRNHSVTGIQLDLLTIDAQIQLTSKTNILVGMHGAGLSHVMFLPQHASLIELFPSYHSTLSHFEFIARWRKIKYFKWKNSDRKMEVDRYTTKVDVNNIVALILKAYKQMCSRGE